MQVTVLRRFLNGRDLVQPFDEIEVTDSRRRDLEANRLIVPLIGSGRPPPAWWPSWRGQTAVIVASGPSAQDVPLEAARDRARFLTVNSSWRLAPWADALFACDYRWWEAHQGAPEFAGLKIGQDVKLEHRPAWGVHRINVAKGQDRLLVTNYGTIGWGGNSGFGALNLAIQFGASRIVLVGFDMRVDRGLHWHGEHGPGLVNPHTTGVERWRRVLDEAAPALRDMRIEVLNASPVSALTAYPKVDFADAVC